MATVRDKSGNSPSNDEDQKFEHPNRTNAGIPQGAVTPNYAGEHVLDTTNDKLYRAFGTSNTDWEPIERF